MGFISDMILATEPRLGSEPDQGRNNNKSQLFHTTEAGDQGRKRDNIFFEVTLYI